MPSRSDPSPYSYLREQQQQAAAPFSSSSNDQHHSAIFIFCFHVNASCLLLRCYLLARWHGYPMCIKTSNSAISRALASRLRRHLIGSTIIWEMTKAQAGNSLCGELLQMSCYRELMHMSSITDGVRKAASSVHCLVVYIVCSQHQLPSRTCPPRNEHPMLARHRAAG